MYRLCIKKKVVYSINMPNTKQNNEIEHINEEMNLLQDRLKNLNQFQNRLRHIRKIRVKKGKRTDLSQIKKKDKI